MALESFGTETSENLDYAVNLLHSLLLQQKYRKTFDPANPGKGFDFNAGEEGVWRVMPSTLDGEPAIEIRIAVG